MSWYLIFCLVYLWLLGALLFRETAILSKEINTLGFTLGGVRRRQGAGKRLPFLFYALWPITLPWTFLHALYLTLGDKRRGR